MAGAKTYDLKSVNIAVAGIPINGFQDGDAVGVSRSNDGYAMASGADGEVLFSKMNDRTGTITFTLLYGSSANKTFSDLAALDAQNNTGLASISIRDTRGGSKIFARQCRVQKIPDVTFAKEGGTLEWIFMCADIDIELNGLAAEQPNV